MLVDGGASSLALAAVWERVLQAGAVLRTEGDAEGLCHLGHVVGRVLGMATGAGAGENRWAMDRVMQDREGSDGVCTLGRWGGLLVGVTIGTPAGWVELKGVATEAAAVSSRALRSEMFWVGVVMPLSAATQSAIAFMSLSVGVIDGLVIDLWWNATLSLSWSLLVDLIWHLCVW